MKAKQYAKELFNKFYNIAESIEWTEDEILINDLENQYKKNGIEYEVYWFLLAKKSAILCIENMLLVALNVDDKMFDYLQDVLKEIQEYEV